MRRARIRCIERLREGAWVRSGWSHGAVRVARTIARALTVQITKHAVYETRKHYRYRSIVRDHYTIAHTSPGFGDRRWCRSLDNRDRRREHTIVEGTYRRLTWFDAHTVDRRTNLRTSWRVSSTVECTRRRVERPSTRQCSFADTVRLRARSSRYESRLFDVTRAVLQIVARAAGRSGADREVESFVAVLRSRGLLDHQEPGTRSYDAVERVAVGWTRRERADVEQIRRSSSDKAQRNRAGCNYVGAIFASLEEFFAGLLFDLARNAGGGQRLDRRGTAVSLAVAAAVEERWCRRSELRNYGGIAVRIVDAYADGEVRHSLTLVCRWRSRIEQCAGVSGLPGPCPRIDVVPDPFHDDRTRDVVCPSKRVDVGLSGSIVRAAYVQYPPEELILGEIGADCRTRGPCRVILRPGIENLLAAACQDYCGGKT